MLSWCSIQTLHIQSLHSRRVGKKLEWVLNVAEAEVAMKLVYIIAQILPSPKDPQTREEKSCILYQVSCSDCEFVYIGQTYCDLKSHLVKHKQAIKFQRLEKSTVCKHVMQFDHMIYWDNSEILKIESHLLQTSYIWSYVCFVENVFNWLSQTPHFNMLGYSLFSFHGNGTQLFSSFLWCSGYARQLQREQHYCTQHRTFNPGLQKKWQIISTSHHTIPNTRISLLQKHYSKELTSMSRIKITNVAAGYTFYLAKQWVSNQNHLSFFHWTTLSWHSIQNTSRPLFLTFKASRKN